MRIRWCFLLPVLLGCGHSLSAEVLYSVTDLGRLPGFPFLSAVAINNAGEVVGNAASDANGTTIHPFLYSNGQLTDLGTLGGERTLAAGLNDTGQVVGYTFPLGSGPSHAFLYSNSQMMDLGPAVAYGINNTGQIVGVFGGISGVYSNGEITRLTPLPGPGVYPATANPTAINNVGQVTGSSDIFDQNFFRPFLYSNGQMINVAPSRETAPGISTQGRGLDLNDAGDVVGQVGDPSSERYAFLYSNGQSQLLGALPGDRASQANAINNAGQVVGWSSRSFGGSPVHPFLYSNGQMTNLNDLIDPALGITLGEPRDINDKGQIVEGPLLLTPVPEPSTFALFGVAVLGLWAWSHRHTH